MNKEVTVTGMEVKTKVGDNLLIARTTTDSTSLLTDENFKTADVDVLDALLEPVSTTDGKAFWYTSTFNVGGSGDALTDVYIDYYTTGIGAASDATNYNNAFSQNYGIVKTTGTAEGYKDYAFFLKANNTDSATKNINVTDIDLTYGGNNDNAAHAFRTAIFVQDLGTGSTAVSGDAGTLKTILSTEGNTAATYYFTDTKAVKTASTLDTVSNYSTNATLAEVPAGQTNYYKVVVRLWLEGEDEICNNSQFNTLTDQWGLTMKIEMKANTEEGVNKFDAVKTETKTDLTVAGVSVASTATSIEGVNYYAITGATIDSKPLYANAATLASATRIYKLDGTHLIDVTNQCTLPTT